MLKHARHFAIKEIINGKPIANQDELRLELRKRKHIVTQATLSRDLTELGVSRVMSAEGPRYTLQGGAAEVQVLKPVVGTQVISIRANESIIVIKTLPGCASIVGEFLDIQPHAEIIGTVAGDNTLLVIPSSRTKITHVIRFLKDKLIEGK
ncbi:MAG: arginine repressor [Ignavibacteriae bacterium]|nr:arginine repressor [Ignavibacteriota bacterium]